MTASLAGTSVAISERVASAHHTPVTRYLAKPEQPAEHCRNALNLLELVRDGHADDATGAITGAIARLKTAIAQLERGVA